jgi:hypothetical protein
MVLTSRRRQSGLLLALAAALQSTAEGSRNRRPKPPAEGALSCPTSAYRKLGDMQVAPILTGMWQVGGGHGYTAQAKLAVGDMKSYTAAGLNCFDLADHYGPAEDFVGAFMGSADTAKIGASYFLTKWVPRPEPMTEAKTRAAVQVSLDRMKVAQVRAYPCGVTCSVPAHGCWMMRACS